MHTFRQSRFPYSSVEGDDEFCYHISVASGHWKVWSSRRSIPSFTIRMLRSVLKDQEVQLTRACQSYRLPVACDGWRSSTAYGGQGIDWLFNYYGIIWGRSLDGRCEEGRASRRVLLRTSQVGDWNEH